VVAAVLIVASAVPVYRAQRLSASASNQRAGTTPSYGGLRCSTASRTTSHDPAASRTSSGG
jgi:hypothetical protein